MPFTTAIIDSFNRANETPIASPWVKFDTDFAFANLASNQLTADVTVNDHWLVHTGTLFNADQEAYMTHVATTNSEGVILRANNVNTATPTGYMIEIVSNTSWEIATWNGTSYVVIATGAVTHTTGQQIGGRAIGNVIEAWHTVAGVWTLLGSVVNNTYLTTGYIGINMSSNVSAIADAFGGGSIPSNDNYRIRNSRAKGARANRKHR